MQLLVIARRMSGGRMFAGFTDAGTLSPGARSYSARRV
jgi:hypothetical protein